MLVLAPERGKHAAEFFAKRPRRHGRERPHHRDLRVLQLDLRLPAGRDNGARHDSILTKIPASAIRNAAVRKNLTLKAVKHRAAPGYSRARPNIAGRRAA